jgi:signal transduction histidine kinase
VSSIIILLTVSQILVHYKLDKLQSDGALINEAGRMRMLSQRLVMQSLISDSDSSFKIHLCETVKVFKEHIVRVNNSIDAELYYREKESFNRANLLANQIAYASEAICTGNSDNSEALNILKAIETPYIDAQNNFVALIQNHYETKLSTLSKIEILLAIITIGIILLEVWLIFLPLDKANSEKTAELKKLLKLQRKISRTVAHDLRSPIGSIVSIHHVLKDEISFKDEKARELYDTIGLAAENAIATASSVLVMDEGDTIEHSEHKKMSLSTLAKAQVSIFSANDTIKNRLILQRTCTNDEVEMNIHEISRMIQNIIDNALKYSEEGVLVEIHQQDNFALLSVKDSGIGMPANLIEWITGKSDIKVNHLSEKGFGLGMEFIKRTVKKHQGFITIDQLPKGTRFTVGLPLAE